MEFLRHTEMFIGHFKTPNNCTNFKSKAIKKKTPLLKASHCITLYYCRNINYKSAWTNGFLPCKSYRDGDNNNLGLLSSTAQGNSQSTPMSLHVGQFHVWEILFMSFHHWFWVLKQRMLNLWVSKTIVFSPVMRWHYKAHKQGHSQNEVYLVPKLYWTNVITHNPL